MAKKTAAESAARNVARAASERESLAAREKRELEPAGEPQSPGRHYLPDTDVYETGDALLVVMEMPGVDRDRLDVRLDDGVLTLELAKRETAKARRIPVM